MRIRSNHRLDATTAFRIPHGQRLQWVFPTSVCRGSRPSWPREIASLWLLRICALNYLTGLAKGEIASLSGAADDPRYFQISVPVQPGKVGVQALACWFGRGHAEA